MSEMHNPERLELTHEQLLARMCPRVDATPEGWTSSSRAA